jgi:hypothetical protein
MAATLHIESVFQHAEEGVHLAQTATTGPVVPMKNVEEIHHRR